MTEVVLTGTLKWYSTTQGYGFVSRDDGGDDLFAHASAFERAGMLTARLKGGERLRFIAGVDSRHRPCVRKIAPPTASTGGAP